jgi:hypothetical protein
MEMLLMGACLSMFGLAVACLAFGAATRTEDSPAVEAAKLPAPAPGRFFADLPAQPVIARTRVPIEALLLEIENHVRLEHAAAECFVESPHASRLHSRTISPLVN